MTTPMSGVRHFGSAHFVSLRRLMSTASPTFTVLSECHSPVEIRGWVEGVPVEELAQRQIQELSRIRGDVVLHPIAVMPDVHAGIGCTVGVVIPTTRALIPSSVGVDIGCGVIAAKTSLAPSDLPDSLDGMRLAIEATVPHGRTHGGRPDADAGSWRGKIPERVAQVWNTELAHKFDVICKKQMSVASSNHINHLGTLGTGNHFIEICVDNDQKQPHVWVMLHSGSRGVGNRVGSTYIDLARQDMGHLVSHLPNENLAYFREGTKYFDDYVEAVEWAQHYAYCNRQLMMEFVLAAVRQHVRKPFHIESHAINCHHNYIERHLLPVRGPEVLPEVEEVWLARKGATSARAGELAVIPGSMGAKSYIVRGKGNPDSYCSCSHGAGRRYSRGEVKRRFTIEDHEAATEGVSCRKDGDVLDETPAAYKDIDAVMRAQGELVDVVCTLKQVLCVKG